MLSAIIVAGGRSQRMGFDKTFALIAGKAVVAHSIAAFEAAPSVAEIVIVGRTDRLAELREIVSSENFGKVRQVCAGGVYRQDSVANGLRKVAPEAEYIAVHDAARPLVRPEQIEAVFARSRASGSAALAAPVRDTLKRAGAERFVSESVSREQLFAMETPQIFARELLLRAYATVAAQNLTITDEVSAVELLQHKVALVPHESWNFKITYPADFPLAEFILSNRV